MLTPTKLVLLIHPLECSVLSWFYHDLYQSKLHHKGWVRLEAPLMSTCMQPEAPSTLSVFFRLFPIMFTLRSYQLFRKLCLHISCIPSFFQICHMLVMVITTQIVSQLSPSLYCADFYYASYANLNVLSHVQSENCRFENKLLINYSMCFPLWPYRYVRFTQTKGHEAFTLHFGSCSYTSSVPFQYRDGGIMGAFMFILRCIHLMAFKWWVKPGLPCFSSTPLLCIILNTNGEGLGIIIQIGNGHTEF